VWLSNAGPSWSAALPGAHSSRAQASADDDGNASLDTRTLHYDQSTIAVHIERGDMGVAEAEILRWVRRAADAIVAYYGRFPVEEVDIIVRAAADGAMAGGTAYGGRRIIMRVGPETRRADLDADWRLTHEMVHLSFPDLDRRHIWMTEGVATYVESIARARAGQVPPEKVWWWMVTGLPKGLPADDDQGLDHTHTWGRTYWGGALYFFLADMMIRRETQNRRAVDDALRTILEAGGDGDARWPIERVVAAGDRATGTGVMSRLYEDMASQPMTPDLDTWFTRLGVRYRDDEIRFDDDAPLAHIRRAVTAPPRQNPTTTAAGRPASAPAARFPEHRS